MSSVTWAPTIQPGGTASLIVLAYTFNSNGLDLPLEGIYKIAVQDAVSGGFLQNQSFKIFAVPANDFAGATWDPARRLFTFSQGAQSTFGFLLNITPSPATLNLTTITAVTYVVTLPGS